MPHHKDHSKLERIKEEISNAKELSESEKSNAIKHIEEWYAEDKGINQLILDMEKVEERVADFLRSLGIE